MGCIAHHKMAQGARTWRKPSRGSGSPTEMCECTYTTNVAMKIENRPTVIGRKKCEGLSWIETVSLC